MISSHRVSVLRARAERGFSMTELLLVVAILAIMLAIAIPSMMTYKENYRTDVIAADIVDVLRFAQQQSLGERQTMRVRIRPGSSGTPGEIEVIDENTITAGAADDEVIRTYSLPDPAEIAIQRPSGVELPQLPFNFNAITYTSGEYVIYFRPLGSITGANADVPRSGTIYIAPTGTTGDSPNADLVRAITFFGPTGSVRLWGYLPQSNNFEER